MRQNNLSTVNLNLLKSLNALLHEQNVSKAGSKLNVTQAAMSLALKQLRQIYQDDLLVRGQRSQMVLTSFAKTLLPHVQLALQAAENAFAAHLPFEPKLSQKTFHLGMSDYIAFVILPKLMQAIAKQAPNIKIVQHAVNYLDSSTRFEELVLDLVVGDFPKAPLTLKTTGLFSDKGVVVADKHHPLMKQTRVTVKNMLRYPQVFVALESQPEENFIAKMLKEKGYEVDIALITPHTLIALQTLPGTLLMTNTVERLAKPFIKPLGLAMRETPYPLRHYQAKLYWHAKDQHDPAHQWLRGVIKEVVNSIN